MFGNSVEESALELFFRFGLLFGTSTTSGLYCFSNNVDFVASQAARKTDVLTAFADSNTELVLRDSDDCFFGFLIDNHTSWLGRAQCILDIVSRFFGPDDDIDFSDSPTSPVTACTRVP